MKLDDANGRKPKTACVHMLRLENEYTRRNGWMHFTLSPHKCGAHGCLIHATEGPSLAGVWDFGGSAGVEALL